jgi:hypothetical protein
MCGSSLSAVMFAAVDNLGAAILPDRAHVRHRLEQAVESAGGYWSPQVDDFAEMLLAEYCGSSEPVY